MKIFYTLAGSGPPLLLLHGFPETHLMWRRIAPALANQFTVVCADLPGYGMSDCPPSNDSHEPYSKRSIANHLIALMAKLGFNEFAVAGHDRGGRVAYRMAIDHPHIITHLAVMDIVPTSVVWNNLSKDVMISFLPWTLLAQEYPIAEQFLMKNAELIVNDALSNWGTPFEGFEETVRTSYIDQLSKADHAHSICEEYRAAATIDYRHDQETTEKIACPVLVLWDKGGSLDKWYPEGVRGVWEKWAVNVRGRAIEGGHFFPESNPKETTDELLGFLQGYLI